MTGQFKLQSRSNLNHAFSVTDDQLSRTNCLDNNNNNCNKNLQPCVALRFDRDTKKIRQPKYKQHIHKCACVRGRVRVYVCESVCVCVCVCECVCVKVSLLKRMRNVLSICLLVAETLLFKLAPHTWTVGQNGRTVDGWITKHLQQVHGQKV